MGFTIEQILLQCIQSFPQKARRAFYVQQILPKEAKGVKRTKELKKVGFVNTSPLAPLQKRGAGANC